MRTSLSSALAGAAATLLLLTSACSSDVGVETVGPDQAVEIIASGDATVIDVRTPAEFAAGHVEGAENIDVSAATFEQQLAGLDKDGEYVVYCQSGNRSAAAAEKMVDLGFTDVVDAGGILSLQSSGASIVTGG